MGLHGLLKGYLIYLYVDDIHTSQETHIQASTAYYGDSFIFLYVNDVPTSQETRLWAFTACYEDSFTFTYVDYVPNLQETHLQASKACNRDSFTFYFTLSVETYFRCEAHFSQNLHSVFSVHFLNS
jgi:hypothetical protein